MVDDHLFHQLLAGQSALTQLVRCKADGPDIRFDRQVVCPDGVIYEKTAFRRRDSNGATISMGTKSLGDTLSGPQLVSSLLANFAAHKTSEIRTKYNATPRATSA